jgi:glycosyltransferase involved in cell wall biosynthesis
MNKPKIFIFSDTAWSIGRVYRGLMKHLQNSFEFRFIDWNKDGGIMNFDENYSWCDLCITNACSVGILSYVPNRERKIFFVSHGFEEGWGTIHPTLTYGITSSVLSHMFPPGTHLVPNGVDPDDFTYRERDGHLNTIGWCGAPRQGYKQVHWAEAIAKGLDIPLSVTANPKYTTPEAWEPMNYDEIREWYGTIDLLIVTSIPEGSKETGPLPPFEAIVSGVPAIGTPVGNFRDVPGPKFTSVEEGIEVINKYKNDPEALKQLAKEQYEYVMNNYTYERLAPIWNSAILKCLSSSTP